MNAANLFSSTVVGFRAVLPAHGALCSVYSCLVESSSVTAGVVFDGRIHLTVLFAPVIAIDWLARCMRERLGSYHGHRRSRR